MYRCTGYSDLLVCCHQQDYVQQNTVWNVLSSVVGHGVVGVFSFWLLLTEKYWGNENSGFSHLEIIFALQKKEQTVVRGCEQSAERIPKQNHSHFIGFLQCEISVLFVRHSECCQRCCHACGLMSRWKGYSILLVCCHEYKCA
jgi:hypothetical protein